MITYNHEKYISQAIEGFLLQKTNFPIELVIGEDCSSDNTRSICEKYVKEYPDKILLLDSNTNLGMIPNLIRTLNNCKRKYIALCEGDDYWTDPFKLQKQIDSLEQNSDINFSMGIVTVLDENRNMVSHKRPDPKKKKYDDLYSLRDYLEFPFSQTSSFVFRNTKEDLPEWFQRVHAGDYSLVIIKTRNGKIKYHREEFSVYRLNENSISHTAKYNAYERFLGTLEDIQTYLGKDYKFILKIIRLKVIQQIKLNNCSNLACRILYRFNIMIINLFTMLT